MGVSNVAGGGAVMHTNNRNLPSVENMMSAESGSTAFIDKNKGNFNDNRKGHANNR